MSADTIQFWDAEPVCPPPRSRLYRLEPVGLGTAYVESMTSYIVRVAAAHSLSVWTLVTREIAPRFRHQVVIGVGRTCDLFKRLAGSLNGNCATANEGSDI